jgi:MoaA/NifB/PqqE/SkfB family radical SAM enzyme
MPSISTIDFHVTARCNQECPYCWGPMENACEVTTQDAAAIVRKIIQDGARRIVFTGGDPLLRADIGMLVRMAKQLGLEVALSTSGDTLTPGFLRAYARWIDLISLPLDGSSETISSRTKKPGHFSAILRAIDFIAQYPSVDLKIATPVTKLNLEDIPAIVDLLDGIAAHQPNRLFYNVFQAFPRSFVETDWDALVVSDEAFDALRQEVSASPHEYRINWLDHATLDRLYVMIFPDGTLTVPAGTRFLEYGPYLEHTDFETSLQKTEFDAQKHRRHSRAWAKSER